MQSLFNINKSFLRPINLRYLSTAVQKFPSLIITANDYIPKGSYAEKQAEFLKPDLNIVKKIDNVLGQKKIAINAHFYMDAELQGIITGCKTPNGVFIADSLAMADQCVKQVKSGFKSVAVLGVDFMSANARAILDKEGFANVPVYKTTTKPIGCSLAEAAEKEVYKSYLLSEKKKAGNAPIVNLIYINTSLPSKAMAQDIIPTISCTSANVLRSVLQIAAQKPDCKICYGPDTYMGNNLEVMLKHLTKQPDEEIKKYHPAHNQKSIAKLLENFSYFKNGNCVVHHMFGDKVVKNIRENYNDAYITAHFEVPGPMFQLAMEKIQKNSGTVGSTSDILNFIVNKAKTTDESFKVVLGTESGMITKLSQTIQKTLKEHGGKNQSVEVIFPVSSEAVTVSSNKELGIVPGVRGSEGCSVDGGCASCPYMKMNNIDGLLHVIEMLSDGNKTEELKNYEVKNKIPANIVDKALKPIFAMRFFQQNKKFPEWAFES
ncbi:hypothetical protein H8356DRAFT_492630 [Neocallimastix lanati (nom. inval.)]|jgi:quinolinate synthase|uniref:quinolinate synthase n=1 Tax=Neocallimastix californiae TaxID=1754190 RepID=A0A1Y2F118_9FUNG|nr:hypothetical protein H8356DRAFT_492630 [Neocallimastix sp. JGI-2020a]ORY77540.1 hypothetical protein LY90DRAFT_698566 [Neocallimastix californiae]|eukprot:ORY77540.1 hypothetical protein LY90DRAFT_698566 [Neocallimastix californiae]